MIQLDVNDPEDSQRDERVTCWVKEYVKLVDRVKQGTGPTRVKTMAGEH